MTDCKTCGAVWDWYKDHLLTPGTLWNATCQECGFDRRLHGDTGEVFTLDEFGEPQ